jgi:hypothetical protein
LIDYAVLLDTTIHLIVKCESGTTKICKEMSADCLVFFNGPSRGLSKVKPVPPVPPLMSREELIRRLTVFLEQEGFIPQILSEEDLGSYLRRHDL